MNQTPKQINMSVVKILWRWPKNERGDSKTTWLHSTELY